MCLAGMLQVAGRRSQFRFLGAGEVEAMEGFPFQVVSWNQRVLAAVPSLA